MKFSISKSSQWSDEVPPVNGAVREDGFRVDQRTFKTVAEHDGRLKAAWMSDGVNHRTNSVGIARDLKTSYWVIEIEDLAGLMKFSEKHGEVIVSADHWVAKDLPHIEIYDSYRE